MLWLIYEKFTLTLSVPTPKKSQTHAVADEFFECDYFVGLALKRLDDQILGKFNFALALLTRNTCI